METYWTLRWLVQEGRARADGVVLRENLVRLDGLPLVVRVPSLPELASGTRVRLDLREVDLVERSADWVYREILPGAQPALTGTSAESAEKA
jgi:exoribonuclease-2